MVLFWTLGANGEERWNRVVWKGDSKGVFFVRELYSLLEIDGTIPFLLKIIWNSWIPLKMSFFTWEACWGKVSTLDQLQRREWKLANRCALYKEELKSIGHILLHCEKWDFYGSWCSHFLVFGELYLSWLRRLS